MISRSHLLVGGAALAFAGVMIAAGLARNAELGGVLGPLGLLLALAAAVFTATAFVALRRAQHGRDGSLSLILGIVELVVGVAMAVGVVVAVQGYGAFAPWRSPLLLPSVLLVGLGLAACRDELSDHRQYKPTMT
jgi:drug/metabolite transporter (DMT)-like permease